uniref:Uncharacterized protein n=1 Tax=Panagrellus redivivus TaxID=6233 RepID=A0A7E4W1S6_PANRE
MHMIEGGGTPADVEKHALPPAAVVIRATFNEERKHLTLMDIEWTIVLYQNGWNQKQIAIGSRSIGNSPVMEER